MQRVVQRGDYAVNGGEHDEHVSKGVYTKPSRFPGRNRSIKDTNGEKGDDIAHAWDRPDELVHLI